MIDGTALFKAQKVRTSAESLDALAAGKLPPGGLLMPLLEALEASVKDRSWVLASQVEVTGNAGGLVNEEERFITTRSALLSQKIATARHPLARGPEG